MYISRVLFSRFLSLDAIPSTWVLIRLDRKNATFTSFLDHSESQLARRCLLFRVRVAILFTAQCWRVRSRVEGDGLQRRRFFNLLIFLLDSKSPIYPPTSPSIPSDVLFVLIEIISTSKKYFCHGDQGSFIGMLGDARSCRFQLKETQLLFSRLIKAFRAHLPQGGRPELLREAWQPDPY